MATKGRKRRQERRATRKENRSLRKNGAKTAFYGGSEEAQKQYQSESKVAVDRNEGRDREANNDSRQELYRARDLEGAAEDERQGYASTAQSSRDAYSGDVSRIGWGAYGAENQRNEALGSAVGTRNQAFAQNQLTGTAENALARRSAELAGSPTIGQAVETSIGANNANAQARLGQSIGLANRQSRGLAGSMGEGGALALQQAMASAGANQADLLAQNNTQQGQLAADLRLQAALRQNQLDVDSANLGLGTRMTAAEQERANQLAIAGANAGDQLNIGNLNAAGTYDAALQTAAARGALMQQDAANQQNAGSRQLNLLGTRANIGLQRQDAAQQGLRDANQSNQFIEGTAAGINQMENQRAYNAAVEKKNRIISTIFDPADFRSSGTKGII